MKLEKQINERLIQHIEGTKQDGKAMLVKQHTDSDDDDIKAYVKYLYDSDDDEELYVLFLPDSSSRPKIGTKIWIHDTVIENDEAEMVKISEIDSERAREKIREYENHKHPKDDVHIVVQVYDDGRYKDDYEYIRESADTDRHKKKIGGYDPDDRDFKFIDLGTFRELQESDDAHDYDYNFRQSYTTIPFGMTMVVDSDERKELHKKLQGEDA